MLLLQAVALFSVLAVTRQLTASRLLAAAPLLARTISAAAAAPLLAEVAAVFSDMLFSILVVALFSDLAGVRAGEGRPRIRLVARLLSVAQAAVVPHRWVAVS